MTQQAGRKQYVVYDERAINIGTDDASILVAESKRRDAMRWPGRGHVYSYDLEGSELVNEQYEGPTLQLSREDADL